MKTVALLIATAFAYILLRGWTDSWNVMLRVCGAGFLLVAALIYWGIPEKSLTTPSQPMRRFRPSDLVVAIVAILLIECAFLAHFALVPTRSEEWAETIQELLVEEETVGEPAREMISEQGVAGGGSGVLVISNWLFSGPGPRPLNKNRKVRPSNRPEIYLYPKTQEDSQALLTSRRFLRNFTLSNYREGVWYPLSIVPKTLEADDAGIQRPPTTSGLPVTYDISHQANSGLPTLAVTIPNFVSVVQPSLRETAPDTFRLPFGTASDGSYRYEVTSIPFDFSKVTNVVPGPAPSPEYLALPDNPELRTRLQNLATTFGPPSRESLLALRNHLLSQCQYSLDLSMPDEAEPLNSFLFETKKGFCTHFASATVMLTRAMGIPSRMGFGWSGGRYYESSNFFVFRAREAHTWAEIYLKDLGWVIFETTPPSRNEGSPSVAPPEESPPLPAGQVEADSEDEDNPLAPLVKAIFWTGGISLVALAAGYLVKRRDPVEERGLASSHSLPKSPNYLIAFREACRALGEPMPPGRTLRDHLSRIDAPAFTDELLDYHYGVQYGNRNQDKSLEKRFLLQLRNWKNDLVS